MAACKKRKVLQNGGKEEERQWRRKVKVSGLQQFFFLFSSLALIQNTPFFYFLLACTTHAKVQAQWVAHWLCILNKQQKIWNTNTHISKTYQIWNMKYETQTRMFTSYTRTSSEVSRSCTTGPCRPAISEVLGVDLTRHICPGCLSVRVKHYRMRGQHRNSTHKRTHMHTKTYKVQTERAPTP